jgi:hypothetical protein
MDIDFLSREVERLAGEAPGGKYRAYFENNHSCDEALRRYGQLFDELTDKKAA